MEIDYEKAYKAALETATQWIKDGCTDKERICLESAFPQLRESEDERIRKSIMATIEQCPDDFLNPKNRDRMLAWLEKQKDTSKAIEAVERIDKYIDEHVANAHDMKDSNPDKKYYRGWDDALAKMSGILQDVYLGEKQKEQKELPLMNGDADLYFDNWNQQKQNPTKRQCFEEGIKYAQRLQKEQIEEDLSTRLNGVMQEYVKEGKDEEDQEHRLKCYQLFWDALGDSEFFKQKEQKPLITGNDFGWIDELKHDLKHPEELDEKVQEVLKKRQKPVECITDAEMEKGWNELTKFKQFASALSDMYNIIPSHSSLRPKDIDWNNFCAGLLTYLKKNQPAEWSEEDERKLKLCEDSFLVPQTRQHLIQQGLTPGDMVSWLKSLRPPLKDKEMKLKILKYLSTRCSSLEFEEVEDYLNNLRPSWKPSEEQMKVLKEAADMHWEPDGLDPLYSLYEDLKKLM